jgi:long-chain acyl-CoA synthetase
MIITFGWINALKKVFTSKNPLRSVPVGSEESHRVSTLGSTGFGTVKQPLLSTNIEGVTSLHDLTQRSFNLYSSTKCMGTREYLGQLDAKVKKFGNIRWRTYKQVGEESQAFGAALRAAGLVPSPEEASLDRLTTSCSLAIFENSCAEWMISAIGAFSQSIIVTTIYATLGIDAVVEAVRDGLIRAMVCNKRSLSILLSRINEMPTLKFIIYTNDLIAPDENVPVPSSTSSVNFISFEDFVASGNTTLYPPTPPTSNTAAVIMYTSGSTGKPKGVVLTHSNVIAAVASSNLAIPKREGDVYLAYLPLAHILELFAEFSILSQGCSLGYADPKTLSATGASPVGALEQFSPTHMAGVPKIWDIIKKGVEAKLSASSPIAKFLVDTAIQARSFALLHGYDTPLFKLLVFKKFSKVVGGRLRLAISGGGPLNSEVQIFIRTVFGCPLFQGYVRIYLPISLKVYPCM